MRHPREAIRIVFSFLTTGCMFILVSTINNTATTAAIVGSNGIQRYTAAQTCPGLALPCEPRWIMKKQHLCYNQRYTTTHSARRNRHRLYLHYRTEVLLTGLTFVPLQGTAPPPRPHSTLCANKSPSRPISPDDSDFVITGLLSRASARTNRKKNAKKITHQVFTNPFLPAVFNTRVNVRTYTSSWCTTLSDIHRNQRQRQLVFNMCPAVAPGSLYRYVRKYKNGSV